MKLVKFSETAPHFSSCKHQRPPLKSSTADNISVYAITNFNWTLTFKDQSANLHWYSWSLSESIKSLLSVILLPSCNNPDWWTPLSCLRQAPAPSAISNMKTKRCFRDLFASRVLPLVQAALTGIIYLVCRRCSEQKNYCSLLYIILNINKSQWRTALWLT